MTVTVVTGGNKGLGRETARRLVLLGHTVYVGARDEGRGKAAASEIGASFVHLDVTDDATVSAAVATVRREQGGLDVLVNNAGVFEGMIRPEHVTADDVRRVFEVNVIGMVRVTHAFLPLLRASSCPVIVNVSSGLGSFGVVTDPDRPEFHVSTPAYSASKAAVDMLTVQFARGLPDVRVNAVEPGFTATDLHGMSGAGVQPVSVGAEVIVRMACIGADGPSGTLSDRSRVLPW